MKAIDTNILIRFLVNDDPDQLKRVTRLFMKTKARNEKLLVSSAIILELIWVLEANYKAKKHKVIVALDKIINLDFLFFPNRHSIEKLIDFSTQYPSLDLSDLFIALLAEEYGATSIISFDKKAQKFEFFEELI